MWMVEDLGEEKTRALISEYMGGAIFMPEVHPNYPDVWERRNYLGVHPQKQEGLSWVRSLGSAVFFSCGSLHYHLATLARFLLRATDAALCHVGHIVTFCRRPRVVV